jgi:hypothetical protein
MGLPRGTERLVIVCDVNESVVRVYAKGLYLSKTVAWRVVEGVKDVSVSLTGEAAVTPHDGKEV